MGNRGLWTAGVGRDVGDETVHKATPHSNPTRLPPACVRSERGRGAAGHRAETDGMVPPVQGRGENTSAGFPGNRPMNANRTEDRYSERVSNRSWRMKVMRTVSYLWRMEPIKGKTVWITGASSGIGEALAYAYARQGAQLILSARREDLLRQVAARCGGQPLVVPLDLADTAALPELVSGVMARIGRLDILVNNGGISQRSLVKDTSFDVDRKLVEVNLLGTIALSKAVLPYFLAQQSGHYVVITSLMGKFGAPMRSSYAAAKHGLHGFFETLRAECWRENVRVTLVCPGYVRTDISRHALTGDGSRQGTMDEATDQGISPAVLAEKIIIAVRRNRRETCIGGKELLGVYLQRFFPALLARIVRTAKTT